MLRVLILGGTGDASNLASRLEAFSSVEVISSLAGRTSQPLALSGRVRSGGFGGVSGLVAYLRAHRIDVLIDATHPFAKQISWNAAEAAQATGVHYLQIARPAWQKQPRDCWIEVETVEAAVSAIPAEARRVFLTIGRQQLALFALLEQVWFLMRSIDPPDAALPIPKGEVLLDRGPFSLAQERSLLEKYQIDVLVSKNSGGDATYAKILAARALQIPVVMVQRPVMPLGESVAEVEGAIAWVIKALAISRQRDSMGDGK
jgi:precorrin-6A/cobalt-precorrin-6A reductase